MAALVLSFLVPGVLGAQVVAEPELRGRVVIGDEERPANGTTVVLHRVDALSAGEVDSVTTGADGAFEFRLPTVPDPEGRGDVYFASATWEGVFYFGMPLTTAVQLDTAYVIQVYDTAVVARGETGARVAVRYLLAEEDADGWFVTDLMQLEIPGDRTLVAADSGAIWTYPLPEEARAVEVGGGDAEGTTAALLDGVLQIGGPMAPGPRQVLVRYRLDSLALTVPVPGGAGEMEFLVREPAPDLLVEGLAATGVVEGEPGVDYRRFAAADLPATVVRITPGDPPLNVSWRWVAVFLGFVFAGAGVWAMRRGSGGAGDTGAGEMASVRSGRASRDGWDQLGGAGADREALVRQVAALDIQLSETGDPAAREELRRTRETLVRRIRELS